MDLNHPRSPVAPVFQAGRRTRGGVLDVEGGHGIEPSAFSGPSRVQDASRHQAPPAPVLVPQMGLGNEAGAQRLHIRPVRDSRF